MKAIVLLSGGLDSATILALAKAERREIFALTFDYGQRHHQEMDAAARVAAAADVREHRYFAIDLAQFGGSALTDHIPVPKDSLAREGIPITYVPARNTIFLAIALGYAETRNAEEIWIGVNALDYSGYPDCRPAFIEAFQEVILKGTRVGVEKQQPRIVAPLLHLTKKEIIQRGVAAGVDYSLTFSCYDPDLSGAACGRCDACLLRKRGFAEAGLQDPTRYLNPAR